MLEYYKSFDEAKRLAPGAKDVERLRTMDLLLRHLPPAPAVVLDVGGGTGAYALPLAESGYQVHLVDPVPRHVETARNTSNAQKSPLASCAVGDARSQPFPDAFADATLLLGPLYHLVEQEERMIALRETYRTLRSGGIVFAAGISRFASLIYGISHGLIADPEFVNVIRHDLHSGQHRTEDSDPSCFRAYTHRPDDLVSELAAAGFSVDRVVGVEGPFWDSAAIPGWNDTAQRELVLGLLRDVETEPSLLGASSHLIAIGRRPMAA